MKKYQNIADKFEKLYHDVLAPINITINHFCYCGCILEETLIYSNVDWTCTSCFKFIPKDITTMFGCRSHECIFLKMNPTRGEYHVCPDCVNGINELHNSENKDDAEAPIIFRKLNHNLDIISYYLSIDITFDKNFILHPKYSEYGPKNLHT